MTGKTPTCTVLLAALTVSGAASAAIVSPTGISGNTPATTTDVGGSGVGALIDGSGLSAPLASDESNAATVTHAGIFGATGAAAHWITNAPNGASTDYYPNPAGDPALTVTFAGVESLGSMYVWGYTGAGFDAGGNSPKAFNVEFFVGAVSQGSVNVPVPAITNPSGDNPAGLVGFSSALSADSLVITVTDNHGDGTPIPGSVLSGGDRVGAGEFAFSDVVRPIPEPSSLALLALAGALAGRRRR